MKPAKFQSPDGTVVDALQVPYKDPQDLEAWVDSHVTYGRAEDGRVGLQLETGDYQVQSIIVVDLVNVRGLEAKVDDWVVAHPDGSWSVHSPHEFEASFSSIARLR